MTRLIAVFWGALVLTVSGVAFAGGAQAQPVPPCAFTLSPPQVVQVDGVSKVTATVTPAGCAGPFRPNMSVACLHLGGHGQCMQARDDETAQVYLEPYQPGATYESSGRGCGIFFNFEPAPECQILGPVSSTL
jgi:hypothetical protein